MSNVYTGAPVSGLTVACVLRSGGVYSPEWVDRLAIQVHHHLRPARMVCLTDDKGWSGPYDFVPLAHDWPGWWSKIELLRPGLFSGPVVYFDLDSVLLKPIPNFVSQMQAMARNGHGLAMLDDFFYPARPASGVMAWEPSPLTERIYHEFAADPKAAMQTRHGDGGWIGRYPHARLQQLFPGTFGSYKAHKLHRSPGCFAHVSFHGKPKQPDFAPGHWVHDAWCGPNGEHEPRAAKTSDSQSR